MRLQVKQHVHPADVLGKIGANEFSGLKVTFINMPLRESARPNTPPAGPLILAAILRQYGAVPSIIDLNAYRVKDAEAERRGLKHGRHLTYAEAGELLRRHLTQQGDQDIIALSGKITTLRWQETVAKIARRLQPDCFLVSGNGLATEIKTGLFNWIPELDAIGRSEGDDIILVIARDVQTIRQRGLERSVRAGLLSPYYTGTFLGKHRFMYEGDRPRNLDALPYEAFDLLERDPHGHNILEDYILVPNWGKEANNSSATPFKLMERSLSTVSSRGCPYACAFCYRGSQGERNWGMRSPEHLARQILELVEKYQVDFIAYNDDNFGIDKKGRIARLPEVFERFGIRIKWGTHMRLDEADDRLIPMRQSGCVYIGFGAESASAKVLKRMDKGGFILKNGLTEKSVAGGRFQFPTTMVNGIVNCREQNIHGNCTWIFGYPGETIEDLKISVAFILWQQETATEGLTPGSTEHQAALASVNRRMFTATAYPGTAMFNDSAVQRLLTEHFGITFQKSTFSVDPVCDDNFHHYVLELDDATKVLYDERGQPLNFSEMTMEQFVEARSYIDEDRIEEVLNM